MPRTRQSPAPATHALCRFVPPVLTGALAILLVAGCVSIEPYNVVKSAEANPFAGQKQFVLEPIRFVDLFVDGRRESDFLAARKGDASKKSWESDKEGINERFHASLAQRAEKSGISILNAAGAAPFTIRPTVSRIETGYYRIPAYTAITRIMMKVELIDAKGVVQDEIYVEHGVAFDAIANPSTGGRMRTAAKAIGNKAGLYLRKRVAP